MAFERVNSTTVQSVLTISTASVPLEMVLSMRYSHCKQCEQLPVLIGPQISGHVVEVLL